MSFYSLSKKQREELVAEIQADIRSGIQKNNQQALLTYFSDEDTYIRKTAYQAVGKIYIEKETLQKKTITILSRLLKAEHYHIRQTVINAAGEIGMKDFEVVEHFFDQALFDHHHTVRNAVIGSVKKMGRSE